MTPTAISNPTRTAFPVLPAERTFRSFGLSKLLPMADALGMSQHQSILARLFNTLVAPWGDLPMGEQPRWPSEVSYDYTPMELSVAFENNEPELRMLIEPQGNPTTLQSSWDTGCQVNQRLEAELGASLERFNQIQDLFQPQNLKAQNAAARFAMCHAFGVNAQGQFGLKLYLNPLAQGVDQAPAVIQAALQRLGFTQAWDFLNNVAFRRGQQDLFLFFSIDLSHTRKTRVKVYLANFHAPLDHLEFLLSGCPDHIPGDVHHFCNALFGADDEVIHQLGSRPALTCFAFTAEQDASPYTATLQVPLRDYIANDESARQRILPLLNTTEQAMYEQVIQQTVQRPLAAGSGLHSFASFKREQGAARTTLYFAPEGYQTFSPHV